MTKTEQKAMIIEAVTAVQGCKATELAAHEGIACNCENFSQLLEEILADGLLVEVTYELPTMNYRTKSFLLPAGTKVNV